MIRTLVSRGSRRAAPLAAALAVGLAGAAHAASTPAPAPGPAKAEPALYLGGLFSVSHSPVTVTGRAFTVTGVVRPYVAGQQVLLKAFVDGHMFKTVKLRLKRSPRGVFGGFAERLSSPGPGTVSVVVEHSRSAGLTGFKLNRSLAALDENVGFGSTGRFVELIQQRLSALHFYIPLTGVYDQGTGLAVDAYHRLLGWGASQLLGPAAVNQLLNGTGSFHVRFPHQGRHAEGDLSNQLLALVNGSQVYWIFPISSGKPSTPTVLGSWQVYRRTPGYLPDGMYYSDFFTGGYAIHGYNPAPDYPASHGCMRLPIVDAIPAFNWLAIGDWVDTYYT
jgi:peptidoglycan hydrolase-like protein with peptidoglycan-binding domain